MRTLKAMKILFDSSAAKKATNLSLNKDLLEKAREQNINLSATLEQALEDKLRTMQREGWLQNNQNAVDSYNAFVEANGIFGEKYRTF